MGDIQKYTPAQIANIQDIKELGRIKNVAEAAAIFYKAQDATLEAAQAQEIKLRCIRQAGTILLPPSQGGQTIRSEGGRGNTGSDFLSLCEDAGVSDTTAKAWQRVARVPDGKFEAYLAEADYYQDEITISGLLKFAGLWYGRSDIAEWETPQWLFELLDDEFHFELDVCASPDNAKCLRYFTKEDDALQQDWHGICWMNPPYGREIKEWMAKATQSAESGATVVCLVPARTDTEWWWGNCIDGEIRFLKGRLTFESAGGPAPFPSAVIVISRERSHSIESVRWWNVQP